MGQSCKEVCKNFEKEGLHCFMNDVNELSKMLLMKKAVWVSRSIVSLVCCL